MKKILVGLAALALVLPGGLHAGPGGKKKRKGKKKHTQTILNASNSALNNPLDTYSDDDLKNEFLQLSLALAQEQDLRSKKFQALRVRRQAIYKKSIDKADNDKLKAKAFLGGIAEDFSDDESTMDLYNNNDVSVDPASWRKIYEHSKSITNKKRPIITEKQQQAIRQLDAMAAKEALLIQQINSLTSELTSVTTAKKDNFEAAESAGQTLEYLQSRQNQDIICLKRYKENIEQQIATQEQSISSYENSLKKLLLERQDEINKNKQQEVSSKKQEAIQRKTDLQAILNNLNYHIERADKPGSTSRSIYDYLGWHYS